MSQPLRADQTCLHRGLDIIPEGGLPDHQQPPLDIVILGHTVLAQDVAVIPETLDDAGGWSIHEFLFFLRTIESLHL